MGRGKYIELTKLKNSTTQPKKKKNGAKTLYTSQKKIYLCPLVI
jgi:hypothetical protein